MPEYTRKIFVTGGNGFIGSRVVEALVSRGYHVRCLLRERSHVDRIRHLPYEAHLGNILDRDSLTHGMRDCDGVIHLAGISAWKDIREQTERLHEVIVEGTRNVLEVSRQVGNPRVVYVSSSITINASETPEVFTERSPFWPKRPGLRYATAKQDAEALAMREVEIHGSDVVVVNPCEVYGPKDHKGVTASNLVSFLGSFPAVVCAGGTSVAHVEDVADGIVSAFEKGVTGERYILGGENLTLEEIARIVRKTARLSDRVFVLPLSAIQMACKGARIAGIEPPIPSDVLEYAALYWFMDSAKAKRDLGYRTRPTTAVFAEVVPELLRESEYSSKLSLRYGGGFFDARTFLMRTAAHLQKRKQVILDSNPQLCGKLLAASDKKGNFLEKLVAAPAWHPIYSVESMDGETWEQLSTDFKKLMGQLAWRTRLPEIAHKYFTFLADAINADAQKLIDSEEISRLTLRILFELLFAGSIEKRDEELFYRASLEWRKEIAVKGSALAEVKAAFMRRLETIITASRFKDGLVSYAKDPSRWLSIFAQPFLISPQINIADIFASVFHYFRLDPELQERAKRWAMENDRPRLEGIVLEAIRLKHPFPILERELTEDLVTADIRYERGTQFFILLDQFRQDSSFDPERWLKSSGENPYAAIPFGSGPRMCIGKPIAMELLFELMKALLLRFPSASVRPEVGHLYSGRDNDNRSTAAEVRYQSKVFAGVLWKSFRLGRASEVQSSSNHCPH